MKTITTFLIRFYQKFLSVFSFGSCRYHPTCSQYAIWQIENNSFFKAIYFTIMRILKCNQLFKGGFDYPKVKCIKKEVSPLQFQHLSNSNNIGFKKIDVKYWYVPEQKNKNLCLVIKNWDYKK